MGKVNLFADINYRNFVDNLPCKTYVASLRKKGELLYISPQYQQLSYSLEDWLTEPSGILRWVHPDSKSKVIQAYELQITLKCEYELMGKDGKPKWVMDEASVVRNEADGEIYIYGVLIDITEFKKTEQDLTYYQNRLEELVSDRTVQLEKQCAILKSANLNLDQILEDRRKFEAEVRTRESYLKDLLESTSEGILGVNSQGCCTSVNQSAIELLGYSKSELIDQNVHAIFQNVDSGNNAIETEQTIISNAILNKSTKNSAEILRCKNGELLYVDCSAYPMKHGSNIIGAVIIFRKVSESLFYQASHEALTGVYNRAEFEKRVARVLSSVHRDNKKHVLCYLEFDRIKMIKNTCGHDARNELIKNTATLLKARLRQRDTIAYFGGEEFSILLENCSMKQALKIVGEIRENVMNTNFSWNYESFLVDVSIGLKELTSSDENVIDAMMVAQSACLQAQKIGFNQVEIS